MKYETIGRNLLLKQILDYQSRGFQSDGDFQLMVIVQSSIQVGNKPFYYLCYSTSETER